METGNFDVSDSKQSVLLFVYEFLGTFLLLTAINFSNNNNLIVPCGVFLGVVIVGKRTGGHFNLGVTIGVFVMKGQFRKNLKAFFIYFVAELLGAFFGMFIAWCYLRNEGITVFPPPKVAEYNVFYVMFVEFFFTFCFHSMIMHAKEERVTLVNDNLVGLVQIMVGMYFAIMCSGGYSGAVLNPTLGIANLFFVAIVKNTTQYLKFMPAYFFGPLLGGALAGFFAGHVSTKIVPQKAKNANESTPDMKSGLNARYT